jgi:hypothetical protein
MFSSTRVICIIFGLSAVAPSTRAAAQARIDSLTLGTARSVALGELAIPGPVSAHSAGFVVLDLDGKQVFAFDTAGRPLWHVGRAGAGPCEFRSMSGVSSSHDTIYVYDASQRRLTLLDKNGRCQRAAVLAAHPAARGTPYVIAIAPDGSVISTWLVRIGRGFSRDSTVLTRHTPTGAAAGALGRWPADQRLTAVVGSEYRVLVPPLATHLSVTACGTTLQLVTGDVRRISRIDAQGVESAPIELPFLQSTIDERRLRQLDDQWIERMAEDALNPADAAAVRELRTALDAGRPTATVGRLLSDPQCRHWVSEPDRGGAVRWWRLDDAGRATATLLIPSGSRVAAIGAGWLVVERVDDDGLRSLQLHELRHR